MTKNVRLLHLAGILSITLLTAIVYWPGLSGPFLLDDSTSIVGPYIEEPGWSGIFYTVTHNNSGLLGRSVSILSFMFTEWQFGLSAWGYKFHNLVLHLVNGLLIYRLLYWLLPLLDPRIRSINVVLTAGIVSSFWLLHPLLVSTVLYAVQRMVELATFFTLLALLSYFRARTYQTTSFHFVLYGWILFPITMLLAILSKEIGVLVPVYVLIFEFLVFKTNLKSLSNLRHVAIWLIVFVLMPVAVGGLYVVTHFSELADYSGRTFTLYERLLTQLHVLAKYMQSILFPRISEMSLFQDDFPITSKLDGYTLLLLIALILMAASIWGLRKRAPVLAFGIAWFLGSHLLESTFVPLEIVFEHRNYLGAIGLILPPIFYILQTQQKEVKSLRWFVAIYFLIFVGQTFSRVQEWSDSGVLLTVAVKDHPTSARAHTEFANYLFNSQQREEAIQQLAATIEIDPENAGAVIHQLVYLCVEGKRNERLLEEAEIRLKTWPASVYALNSIGQVIAFINRGACQQLVLDDIEPLIKAALSQPGNVAHPRNHGYLWRFLGIYNFHKGNYQEGVNLMLRAHEISGNVVILEELIRFQTQLKQFKAAEQTLDLLKKLNEEHFGIETYMIEKLTKMLADASSSASPNGNQLQTVESDAVDPSTQ